MRKDLPVLFLFILFTISLSFGRGGNIEYEFLAYSHKTLPIERLYFISREYAIGVGNSKRGETTALFLLDKHNLVRDTFYTSEKPLAVIPSNDSTIFIQEKTRTLEILIRENRILLKNQLTINDLNPENPCKILREPLFLGKKVVGKSYLDKKSYKKKDYCLKMLEYENGQCNKSNDGEKVLLNPTAHNARRRNQDIEYALKGKKLFVFQNSTSKLIKVSIQKDETISELDLPSNQGWEFHFDHIAGNGYLTKPASRRSGGVDLFLIVNDKDLVFQETLNEAPFGVVDNRVHIIKKKKDQYFHHLIPLSLENGIEKNNFLQEVQILAN
jgi:hypothetical protein